MGKPAALPSVTTLRVEIVSTGLFTGLRVDQNSRPMKKSRLLISSILVFRPASVLSMN